MSTEFIRLKTNGQIFILNWPKLSFGRECSTVLPVYYTD